MLRLGSLARLRWRMKRSVTGNEGVFGLLRVFSPALPLVALGLLTGSYAGLLAGCGGGSSTSSPAVPVSPAASATQGSAVSAADAVALVSGTPIAKSSYAHWLAIE